MTAICRSVSNEAPPNFAVMTRRGRSTMPTEWKAHRTLRAYERRALTRIRDAIQSAAGGSPAAGSSKFDRLAELLAACRDTVPFLRAGAPYASPAERAFIELVAHKQRALAPDPDSKEDAASALADYFADYLWSEGMRLPISAGSEVMAFRRSPTPVSDVPRLQNGTLKQQVVELLTGQRSAYRHELLALGLSRQYLSKLIRRGIIVHSGRGIYRLHQP